MKYNFWIVSDIIDEIIQRVAKIKLKKKNRKKNFEQKKCLIIKPRHHEYSPKVVISQKCQKNSHQIFSAAFY